MMQARVFYFKGRNFGGQKLSRGKKFAKFLSKTFANDQQHACKICRWQDLITFRHVQVNMFQFSSSLAFQVHFVWDKLLRIFTKIFFTGQTLANLSKIGENRETYSLRKFLPLKYNKFSATNKQI